VPNSGVATDATPADATGCNSLQFPTVPADPALDDPHLPRIALPASCRHASCRRTPRMHTHGIRMHRLSANVNSTDSEQR